jgi:DNA modification methylase
MSNTKHSSPKLAKQITNLQIVNLPIELLKPDPENAREHSPKQIRQIAKNEKRYGFLFPVLISADYKIICGHARTAAAKLNGLLEVPTIQVDHLSEAERRVVALADNRLAEKASWNKKFLKKQLELIVELDPQVELEETGFDLAEIEVIEQEPADVDDFRDPVDRLPSLDAGPTITRPGDLWLLDDHRVLCADMLASASLPALMAGCRAHAVFTDPPYNVRVPGHVSGKGATKHRNFAMASGEMTKAEFTTFLMSVCSHVARHSIRGAVVYSCIDWRHWEELQVAARSAGLEMLNACVWMKPTPGMGSFYRSQHEIVLVLRNGNTSHRNNVKLGSYGRNRSNVWQYPNPSSFGRGTDEGKLSALHPTVKPVAMIGDALLDCTKRGDVVLDPFLGLGSTLMAAERTKRRCYGVEIDPRYVDCGIRRWQVHGGGQARHAENNKTFDEIAAERISSPPDNLVEQHHV